ncbi:AbrB/MazE/SpoVT family DNA-binding domain-containing protein [Prosthecomicrobium pneumaticum]|uniref:Bifunctional DNA-binding transcriptional regulator/antitoxin component of YhaV-PrlF toxin-antitoxin module n=1 Tax=Prosthecomicrobium pneumaticum TaxID=81895 RepID=A0A7W9CVL8_9HYPH|nr:AbrB/MazE/SpoVT family DNA-binding domain-containing protein [Prosthecomicrobium pneumaticum]MBB5752418.1 bifunctional DNA-binding transcriptional regulator/antitoxin component of YhaV-PrlF toxin-antitoxin module [Prosthecomicrobium pneumaticum]
MPSFTAKVAEDGSVRLPPELRERLGIEPGAEVEFFVTLDGHVYFHHLTDGFPELGKARRPPLSPREMDEAIADHLAAKNAPRRRGSRSAAE